MKLKPPQARVSSGNRLIGGFTLAEVLAAMLLMAIVIPVAVEGIRLASEVGQNAVRKTVAAQICERVINELVTTGQWRQGFQEGVAWDGPYKYEWKMDLSNWYEGSFLVLTVQVNYTVQNKPRTVELSTLVSTVE